MFTITYMQTAYNTRLVTREFKALEWRTSNVANA